MLLAVETATRQGSVALYGPDGLIQEAELPDDAGRNLAETVRTLVAGRFDQLEGYAISVGPGSFTGLRIGLAFVKGLAVVQGRPLLPVSTLEVLAGALRVSVPDAPYYLPALDARKQEVYAVLYRQDGTVDPVLPRGLYAAAEVVARTADKAVVAGGDGVPHLGAPPGWTLVEAQPRAAQLAALAWPRLRAGEGVPGAQVELLYDQPAAAERNLGILAPPFDSRITGA